MRKKILIAVIVLVLVVAGIGTGVAFWQNGQSGGGQQTAQEKDKDKKDKEEQKKEDGEEELTPEEAQEALEEQLAANTYVDQGGVKATGTSASESFSIRMSKLCTFSDPAGLSFDKRYVLYGGSDCTPARRAGKDCIGAYEILYVKNGKPVGEYMCYVMNSESAAKSVVQKFSGYNGDGGRVGRWGDVAYVYSTGAYVQTSIDTYYKAGSIKEATPEAYLGMQFYFRGMTEYKDTAHKDDNGVVQLPTVPVTPDTPENPGGTENPVIPDTPVVPDTPVIPDPDNPDKVSFAPIVMSASYTFEDPEDISFDGRYVIFGGTDSMALKQATANGIQLDRVYDILYVESGKAVRDYQCYVAKSAQDAQAMNQLFGGAGKVYGDVMVMANDQIQANIDMVYQLGMISAATPEAYISYTLNSDAYSPYYAPITMTSAYTFADPNDLHFDKRYVIYGDETCLGATGPAQMGCTVNEVYEILYSMDGKALRDYTCYVAADETSANMIASVFGGTVYGTVAVVRNDNIQEQIDMVAGYGIISAPTADAYVQYTVGQPGYSIYEGTGNTGTQVPEEPSEPTEPSEPEEPTEPEEPVEPEEPSDPNEIQMTDDFIYRDAEQLPEGVKFDQRFAYSGDETNPFASAYGAKAVYGIVYGYEGKAAGEYKIFVMADEVSASALNEQFLQSGLDSKCEGNVVLQFSDGNYVQSTIDTYVQYGFLTEATPEAYAKAMYGMYGMTEIPWTAPETSETAAQDPAMLPQKDDGDEALPEVADEEA